MSPINYDSFKSIYDLVFALSFLIISYLQVLSSKFIKYNHCSFSIYSFRAFFIVVIQPKDSISTKHKTNKEKKENQS